jgi:heme/copper-type cytochrome/quinol oxidase subunit 3
LVVLGGAIFVVFCALLFRVTEEEELAFEERHRIPVRVGGSLASAFAVTGGVAMFRAVENIREGRSLVMRRWLTAAAALASTGIAIEIIELAGLGFSSQDHASGSIFHLLSWFIICVGIAAIVMAVLLVVWSFRVHYAARRHVPVDNVAIFWLAMTIIWVGMGGVLHLAPRLT